MWLTVPISPRERQILCCDPSKRNLKEKTVNRPIYSSLQLTLLWEEYLQIPWCYQLSRNTAYFFFTWGMCNVCVCVWGGGQSCLRIWKARMLPTGYVGCTSLSSCRRLTPSEYVKQVVIGSRLEGSHHLYSNWRLHWWKVAPGPFILLMSLGSSALEVNHHKKHWSLPKGKDSGWSGWDTDLLPQHTPKHKIRREQYEHCRGRPCFTAKTHLPAW